MGKKHRHALLSGALWAAILAGCTSRPQATTPQASDSLATACCTPDTAYYGHLGEGTGMSCLELVTDRGDTLVLSKTDARNGDPGRILGEIDNYTDRYAITTRDSDRSVLTAVNMSQLMQRQWTSDADPSKGFVLDSGGAVGYVPGKQTLYAHWELWNCQLVLQANEAGAESPAASDTLCIEQLSPDSLVLRLARTGETETFRHI